MSGPHTTAFVGSFPIANFNAAMPFQKRSRHVYTYEAGLFLNLIVLEHRQKQTKKSEEEDARLATTGQKICTYENKL
jgi:hypothetical protein